jgi:peptidoglycan/xylan/chitin deacetylase (PgdA/CDA1 family)
MSLDEMVADVTAWEEAVEEAVGAPYRARWFRPPYMDGFEDGAGARSVRRALAALGYSTALWGVETYYALEAPSGPQVAGSDPGAEDVARHVLDSVRPGSIVLLHFSERDVGALPAIIDGLRARGLEPVGLSELFERQAAASEGAQG